MKKSSDFLSPAPNDYVWPRCPEADEFIEKTIEVFLSHHRFARMLSERMKVETSTLFSVWVDHLLLPASHCKADHLKSLGFVEEKAARRPKGAKVYWHPFADLPRLLTSATLKEVGCSIAVDDIWRFALAHGLSPKITGAPFSTLRFMGIPDGSAKLYVIERRGTQDFMPDNGRKGQAYIECFERWVTRQRHFDSDTEGMKATLKLAKDIVKAVGTGPAATLFLEGERIYWQSRNHAAQVQKARQDVLGLGWANHDHHTFRSSRMHFPMLIQILLTLGFKKRERYYAGNQAGWGAQIMEQPEAGVIIFADVDLAPDDVTVDFSKVALPDLQKPGTVGLWCALHGESMLQAGMHHLEAKFDFELLKKDLAAQQVETMAPFSDFSFLRQAFTKAEMWQVGAERLRALESTGKLSKEACEQIRTKGAVGSHMENLQRHDGFKGFNQKGVSDIISKVNPEKQALNKPHEPGGA